ncbi:globin domain-containing protein, partial [Listeria fleischmannii]|uniref:globin domain-containing protein n=1 Tax=Listeria fleischmannii TaxID=1069827 RepID=UPI00345F11E0
NEKQSKKKGCKQKALANTVLAAAKHIDDLSVLADYIQQIGYKHRALQVKAEHYPLLGIIY